MTRTGKIARLPLAIRNALGTRLQNGEPGKTLVAWLNTLPEVQQTMAAHFQGRPITQQNLSEWKQRGYLDWLRHQEALAWASQMQEQVAELTQATNRVPLSEALSTLLAVALGRSLRTLMAQPLDTGAQRRELFALSRELTRLRSADLHAATLSLQQERQTERPASQPVSAPEATPVHPGESDSIRPNPTQLNHLKSVTPYLATATPPLPHPPAPPTRHQWRRAG